MNSATPDEPSPDEIRLLKSLDRNVNSLSNYCINMQSAVDLFDFALSGKAGASQLWAFTAGREGAMTLRNFKVALASISHLIGRCPSWEGVADKEAISAANHEFQKRFPGADKLRHTVAHPEWYNNSDKDMTSHSAHSVPGMSGESGATIMSSFAERKYLATIEGVLVSYELSSETADVLCELRDTVCAAFRPSNTPLE